MPWQTPSTKRNSGTRNKLKGQPRAAHASASAERTLRHQPNPACTWCVMTTKTSTGSAEL